ncbi:MAG: hypothetical protein LBL87_05640 [Ruminococcus sp.]|jgi:hypothetical protein|nr:hypothetical protein [Ruminococcus sp.]
MADLSAMNAYSNSMQNNPQMKNLYDILNNQDDKSIFSGGSARSQAQKIMEQYDEKTKADAAANTDKSEVDPGAAAQAKTAADVVGAADKFYTSGAELMNNAKNAESGKTIGEVSAAEGGVNLGKNITDFVNNYNKTIDEAKAGSKNGTLTNGDAKKTKALLDTTAAYEKKLAEMGITIGSDNKLSINTDKMNAASTDLAKELFSGAKSFGAGVMRRADALTGYTASAYDRNIASQYGGGNQKGGLAAPASPLDNNAGQQGAAAAGAAGETAAPAEGAAATTDTANNTNAQTAANSVTNQQGYTPPKAGGYDPIAAAEQRAREREEAAKLKVAAGVQ